MNCLRDNRNENLQLHRLLVLASAFLLFFCSYLTAQVATTHQQQPDIEKGEITLSIGDGFVFGESEAQDDADRSKLDLYVQDIRHGVSLMALAGCTVPAQPMTSAGLPKVPLQLMALLHDAPLDLPKRDLWLLPQCSSARPGIGLVKSRSGKAYKLCLLDIKGHPKP